MAVGRKPKFICLQSHLRDRQTAETTLRFTHIYMEVSNRLLRNMVRYLRDSAFVVHYMEFVLVAALRNSDRLFKRLDLSAFKIQSFSVKQRLHRFDPLL